MFGPRILKLVSAFCGLLFAVPVAVANPARVTIADLDAILDKAPDAVAFVKSPELLNEYYAAAVVFYGGEKNFSRASFDAVTKSVTELFEKVPESADRAWQSRSVRPVLTIRSPLKSYPVTMIKGSTPILLEQMGLNQDHLQPQVPTKEEAAAKLTEIKTRMDAIYAAAASVTNARERQRQISTALAELKESPEALAARLLVLHRIAATPEVKAQLKSEQAEIVLNILDRIRLNPEVLEPELAGNTSAMRFLMTSLPQPGTLTGNVRIFAPLQNSSSTGNAVYEFADVKRRFHSLFRGIPANECVGGWSDYLHLLTATRYAIPLLDGGFEIQVFRDGEYAGFLSESRRQFDGVNYFTLDVLSRDMVNSVVVASGTGATAKYRKVNLFDAWFEQENRRLPADVKGLVIGMSGAINNTNGNRATRLSEAWINAREVGPANDFASPDPLAAKILELGKPNGVNDHYNSKTHFIDETGVSVAATASLLVPGEFDTALLDDVDWVKKQFADSHHSEAKFWTSSVFRTSKNAAVAQAMYDEAWLILVARNKKDHPNHEAAMAFSKSCSTYCWMGLIRTAMPKERGFPKYGTDWIGTLPETFRGSLIEDFLSTHLDGLVKHILAENDRITVYKETLPKMRYVSSLIKLMAAMSAHARNPDEFLAYTEAGFESASDGYRRAIGKVIVQQIPFIATLGTKPHHWNELSNRTGIVENRVAIWQGGLPSVKSGQDLLDLIAYPKGFSPSDAMKNEKSNFLQKNVEAISKLNPNTEVWLKLIRGVSHIGAHIALLQAAIDGIKSPIEFVRVVKYGDGFKPSQGMNQAMDRFLEKNWDKFLSLYPSLPQNLTMLQMVTDKNLHDKLFDRYVNRPRAPLKTVLKNYCDSLLSPDPARRDFID